MSNSYATITVIGGHAASRFKEESLPALPFACFCSLPDARGNIVLYPETVRDVPDAADFAAALFSFSIQDAIVLLATVDLEDSFGFRVFHAGASVHSYRAEPGRIIGEELPPSGHDAGKLVRLFGIRDNDTIRELSDLLMATRLDEQFGFGEAKERHREIIELLDLPPASVGTGFDSIQHGLVPDGLSAQDLRHFPADDGFASTGLKLRQHVLFHPVPGESHARTASRFLVDVIAWEDDFLEEPTPVLGTVEEIRDRFIASFPELERGTPRNWLSVIDSQNDLLEIDLTGKTSESVIETSNIFTLSLRLPVDLFARLCAGTPWAVWSYESRQTVYRSATIID